MKDCHGHYAYGIDDGLKTKEDVLKTIQTLKKQNIDEILMTPHLRYSDTYKDRKNVLLDRMTECKEIYAQNGIKAHFGSEIFADDQLTELLEKDGIIPINHTNYLLLEFDVTHDYSYDTEAIIDQIERVFDYGYKVILAHVERYFKSILPIEFLQELMDMGVYFQVNSTSFMHESLTQKFAYQLLQANMIHIIASDTHYPDSKRYPNLLDLYQLLSQSYDIKGLNLLMDKNPSLLYEGKPLLSTSFIKKGLFKTKYWMK